MASAPKTRIRLAIVGFPAVGKSSFVAALHGRPVEAIAPTEGCNKSNITRGDLTLDLIDLGGKMAVRKFWSRMAEDADGLIVVANAAEADDLTWSMLGQEVRGLRNGRPTLVLLNARDASPRACLPAAEALDRLGLADERNVDIHELASSSDVAAADPGMTWLCDEIARADGSPRSSRGSSRGSTPDREVHSSRAAAAAQQQQQQHLEPEDDDELDHNPTVPPPPSGSRMRALRGLRDARQWADAEKAEVEDLQRRLIAGHILSEEEMALLRLKPA